MPTPSPVPDPYDDNDFDPLTPSDSGDEERINRPQTAPKTPVSSCKNSRDNQPGSRHTDDDKYSDGYNGGHNEDSFKNGSWRSTVSNRCSIATRNHSRQKSIAKSALSYSKKRDRDSYDDGRYTPYSDDEGHNRRSAVRSRTMSAMTRVISRNGGAIPAVNGADDRNASRLSHLTDTAKYDNYADDFDNEEDYFSDFDDKRQDRRSPVVQPSPPSPKSRVTSSRSNRSSRRREGHDIMSPVANGYASNSERVSQKVRSPAANHETADRVSAMPVKHVRKEMSAVSRRIPSNLKSYSRQSRMTSAHHLNSEQLRRDIRDITDEIESLKVENKSLKRNNILLSHQLEKREREELEVPNLYDRHAKEIKALKDHLSRSKERFDKVDDRLRKVERELRRSEKVEKDLEALAEEEDLKERSRLRKQLERVAILSSEADQRIVQLEKYAENLEKCHESELAAESEKHQLTLSMLHDVSEQALAIKQSVESKESELDKFRIQHTSRHTLSRAHMNTSLSGVMCQTVAIPEAPGQHVNRPTGDLSANRMRGNTAVIKALPAPEQSPKQSVIIASKGFSPSPPTSSRPAKKTLVSKPTSRALKVTASDANGSKVAPPKRTMTLNSSAATQLTTAAEELRREKEEERRAELHRTNMVLSLKGVDNEKDVKLRLAEQTDSGSQAKLDPWQQTNTAVEGDNSSGGIKGDGGPASLNSSLREQTFVLDMERQHQDTLLNPKIPDYF